MKSQVQLLINLSPTHLNTSVEKTLNWLGFCPVTNKKCYPTLSVIWNVVLGAVVVYCEMSRFMKDCFVLWLSLWNVVVFNPQGHCIFSSTLKVFSYQTPLLIYIWKDKVKKNPPHFCPGIMQPGCAPSVQNKVTFYLAFMEHEWIHTSDTWPCRLHAGC